MSYNKLFIIITIVVLFCANRIGAQSVSTSFFGSLSGTTASEELGTILKKADVDGDGLPELFISAPAYGEAGQQRLGRIYMISMPIESDSALDVRHIIIQGKEAGDNIGRSFDLADFNGDGIVDIVIADPTFSKENGRVLIFFGPFSENAIRYTDDADIVLVGNNKEALGSSIALIPAQNGNQNSGLLIGANGFNGYSGKVYYYDDFTGQLPSLSTTITGIGSFELLGATVQFIGDVNGDGEMDIAVSAPKHTNNLPLQGITYLFFGPLSGKNLSTDDANVSIFGNAQNTLWSGKIFAYKDLNNDGLDDFALGSDGDENGKLALFYGRAQWADSIYIGQNTPAKNAHVVLTAPDGVGKGFGFSTDFTGDYNFDGTREFLFSAPYGSNRYGTVYMSNVSGGNMTSVSGGISNNDGLFGTQVLNLGSVNSAFIDPYGVDDFAVSAPGANALSKWGGKKTGVISFFSGVLNPPKSSLTVNKGGLVTELTDSVRVLISSAKGSRPITSSTLYLTTYKLGEATQVDSIHISNTTTYIWLKQNKFGRQYLYHHIEDELGLESESELTLYFSARPAPFNLITEFDERLVIQGDRNQEIDFRSEASSDSNGTALKYDLIFGLQESNFTEGIGLTVVKSSKTPEFKLSYLELNTFLLNNGFVNLNLDSEIFWSIRVSNSTSNIELIRRMAANGPRSLQFVRKGLEPYFNLTSGGDRTLLLEGLSSESFVFKWSSLISENPNAVVDYRFVLVKDTTTSARKNPLISEYSDPSDKNTYKLGFNQLSFLLQENDVLEQAKVDTVRWFYTVEAIIDGQEDKPWFAAQGFKKADILYSVVVSNEEQTAQNDLPAKFELFPNYPNPFNPTTQLKFSIPEAMPVRITIFNLLGQNVYSWSSAGLLNAGFYEHSINARDWSSGIYIYQIHAGGSRLTGKMSLVK